MEYYKEVTIKDGRTLILRNGEKEDSLRVIENFKTTHGESDFLLSLPEECLMTEDKEAAFLEKKKESEREVEILAFLDGVLVGTAGVDAVGRYKKLRHRSVFGISVLRSYWGLGIGRAMTESCIECAKKAGYEVLELEVVKENIRAISLYSSLGFSVYGENNKAMKREDGVYQPMLLMSLEL